MFLISRMLMTSLVESLCTWFDWVLTIARGQRGNFMLFLPVSGLPLPLLVPCLSPRSFARKLYKGKSGVLTVYQFLASSAATIAATLVRFWASSQPPRVTFVDARQEPCPEESDGEKEDHERIDQLGAIRVFAIQSHQSPEGWVHRQGGSGHLP
jgi:hypothetical protein